VCVCVCVPVRLCMCPCVLGVRGRVCARVRALLDQILLFLFPAQPQVRQRTTTSPFLPLPRPSLAVQGEEDGRSAGRGLSACCDSRVRCARLLRCAHPSHASHAALLLRWQSKGSSLRCHCKPRVPSTDTASSRTGVIGRV